MPKLDGFDFVSAIRRDTELAATPIVMLSARAGDEAVSEGYAGGADDYLPKPFRSQELVERVAARLSAANRERAGQQQREAELRHTSAAAQLDAALQAAELGRRNRRCAAGLAARLGRCDHRRDRSARRRGEQRPIRVRRSGARRNSATATTSRPWTRRWCRSTSSRPVSGWSSPTRWRSPRVMATWCRKPRTASGRASASRCAVMDGNVIGSLGLLWSDTAGLRSR